MLAGMPDLTRRQFACSAVVAAAAPLELSKRGPLPLLRREQWKPFPTPFAALSPALLQQLIEAGVKQLGGPWTVLPATSFLEFKREGNRSRYEAIRNERRNRVMHLALAECAEGKGRFLDELLNGLWATCEETYWGVPAHISVQRAGNNLPDVEEPTVDLFAAETGAMIAWIDHLLGPKLDGLVRRRLYFETDRRILTPCLTREDFGWMGLRSTNPPNNWNPWICSNWLAAALLMEANEARRAQAAAKILRCLDRFLAGYAPDGGCDEGPSYWGRAGASLFDNLETLHSATAGQFDVYSEPLIREIGRYITKVHIAGDWYVNFADASARMTPAGDLIYRYGKRIGDEAMMRHGAWVAQKSPRVGADSLGRTLPALFNHAEIAKAAAGPPLLADAWFEGVQVLAARQKGGSEQGLYLAAQGGHNAESHNHNDVGNFMVFASGRPALIDIGVETYTAQTFSARRYEIWTMQSAWHNCPTINGQMQGAGRAFEARNVESRITAERAELKLDIEKAYPAEARCRRWTRRFVFDRARNTIEVSDDFELETAGLPVEFSLITPVAPQLAPGRVTVPGLVVVAHEAALSPASEEHACTDARLRPIWGERVWRTRLRADRAPQSGRWVLRITEAARA